MAIVDKIQGAFDKITKDDTRVTSAELTVLHQTFTMAQLGFIKNEMYMAQVKDPALRELLQNVGEELLQPALVKARKFLEKANVPFALLNPEERKEAVARGPGVLNDQEIALDAMYWLQAGIAGAQTGALMAVRGDVRDFFLNQRDQGMDLWRQMGLVVFRIVPNAIPPQVQVTGQASP